MTQPSNACHQLFYQECKRVVHVYIARLAALTDSCLFTHAESRIKESTTGRMFNSAAYSCSDGPIQLSAAAYVCQYH